MNDILITELIYLNYFFLKYQMSNIIVSNLTKENLPKALSDYYLNVKYYSNKG